MNASFRTAFWAMCLGLTVPMVLFVGVELTTGSKARHATSLAAADRDISLRTQLAKSTGSGGGAAPAGSESAAAQGTKTATSRARSDGKVVLDPLEVDPADSQVVLGPGLEPVPATSAPIAEYDRRIPASPVAETRPRVTINPDIETVPQASTASTAIIEARLAGIQQHLDKLGRAIDAQVKREPAEDPIKQATELLKQLQEAHLINPPASPRDELAAAKSNGDEPAPQRTVVDRDQPSPVTETSSDPAASDAGVRADEPKPVTRIYRPRYLSGSGLYALVAPLLTPNLGRAGAADMASDAAAMGSAGSSSISPADALVVSDLPDVIRKVDMLFQKLDAPPASVVIEAVVLSVQLNNGMPNGINLLDFNGPSQPFTMTTIDGDFATAGAGQSAIPSAVSDPLKLTRKYGLKRGILNGDPQAFLGSLQATVPTLRTDAWQMTVVNRQPANLMLTDPLGTGGSSEQSAAGTILKIRPVIARNGVIHLDVRREVVLDFMAVSGTRAAALTNQFSLHDGQTAVIGGFFADQSVIQLYRPSGFGRIPLFGDLFCKHVEAIERTETIVLLTPHVVSAEAEPQVSHAAITVPAARPAWNSPKVIHTSGTASSLGAPKMRPAPQ
jgi:type II secretory pathway component GspD/PulD (secretin)